MFSNYLKILNANALEVAYYSAQDVLRVMKILVQEHILCGKAIELQSIVF